MARAREVLTPMPERLAAAARAVADANAALQLARQQRDELVVSAIDEEGISQRAVARAAGLTVGRVCAILANPGDEDE
jgi:hypothetical protein